VNLLTFFSPASSNITRGHKILSHTQIVVQDHAISLLPAISLVVINFFLSHTQIVVQDHAFSAIVSLLIGTVYPSLL